MKQYNHKKGKSGEEIAESFLIKNGFQILEKNWKNRFGEMDLIATKNNRLHFVEVKLKVGDMFGAPEEMINKRKLIQVMRTAESYLISNKKVQTQFHNTQIDAVCIVLTSTGEVERLDYYENLTADL